MLMAQLILNSDRFEIRKLELMLLPSHTGSDCSFKLPSFIHLTIRKG